jgi:hypothetical protein
MHTNIDSVTLESSLILLSFKNIRLTPCHSTAIEAKYGLMMMAVTVSFACCVVMRDWPSWTRRAMMRNSAMNIFNESLNPFIQKEEKKIPVPCPPVEPI